MTTTRRTSDPLALNLHRQLRHRRAADQVFVLRAVEHELARRQGAQRRHADDQSERAVECLRAFHADKGSWPSRAQYDEWIAGQPDISLMSSGQVRRACGGWTRALEAAGQGGSGGVLSRRLLALGRKSGAEQLTALLCACAADHEHGLILDFKRHYLPWARGELQRSGSPRFDVVIIEVDAFTRRFGSFNAALRESGLPHAPTLSNDAREFSDAELLQFVTGVAGRLSEPSRLTATRYMIERKLILKGAAARGERLRIPNARTISIAFGGWGRTMVAAGLVCETDVRRLHGRSCTEYRDGEIDAALLLVAREHGGCVTLPAYKTWRRRTLAERPGLHIPSDATLRNTFGRWPAVRARMRRLLAQNHATSAQAA